MRADRVPRGWFALTLLLGAFLMFFVQPLAGKLVTPKFGGVAQVWCVCLLFFQTVLLGGYSLSFLISKLFVKVQGVLYIGLFVLCLLLLNVSLGEAWMPGDPGSPILSLIGLLMRYLAFPCILLSTVSVLLQNWYRLSGWGDPYHLYSISNVGSLGALAAYPILIEPSLAVSSTVDLWTWGFRLLTVMVCVCAFLLLRKAPGVVAETAEEEDNGGGTPGVYDFFLWVSLSAAGSILLISFTNYLTQDIAPVPLLWVVPLCIYLLSFILCFSRVGFYSRNLFVYSGMILIVLYLIVDAVKIFRVFGLFVSLLVLFVLCMVCQGELYENRPRPRYLTGFYLVIALGGVLGGVAVNFVAPLLFDTYFERYLIVGIMMLFLGYLTIHHGLRLFYSTKVEKVFLFLILTAAAILLVAMGRDNDSVVYRERNFYGTLKIQDTILKDKQDVRVLVNGRILHGFQYVDKEKQNIATAYLGKNSGFGVAERFTREHRAGNTLKIGVIGLGVGTIASYGRSGDSVIFYEIDPKVKKIAENHFSFLKDSDASVEVILGDARTTLEREPPREFDILVVDAFNGDAIPVHLLTVEAMKLYLRHLKEDGLLVLHVSNGFLDLSPLTANQGLLLDLKGKTIHTAPQEESQIPSYYTVLSRKGWFVDALSPDRVKKDYPEMRCKDLREVPPVGTWTDDFSNLWDILQIVPKKKPDALSPRI